MYVPAPYQPPPRTGRLHRPLLCRSGRRGIQFLFLLACYAGSAFAQTAGPASLDPALRSTQYVHDVWQVEDGLPQNSIYAALQTRDGYLWLGTQEGLARFDGQQFTVFDETRLDGMRSYDIRALLEARQGGLWIGTNGGGISRLHAGKVTSYSTEHGMSGDLVRALYEDDRGHLWIGTIDGGLTHFDGKTFVTYGKTQGLSGRTVLALQDDARGGLWVGTEAGLFHYQAGRFTSLSDRHPLAGSVVWALHRDETGRLWAGTTGGLLRIGEHRIDAYTDRAGLCGTTVAALHEDEAGTLWIGTLEGGLCRLRDDRFETFSTKEGLTNDRVRALARDREGSLWIGTDGGGLNRLRTGKFIPFTTSEGLSQDVAFTVLEDRAGALWVGTEGGGLNRIRDGRVTHFSTANGLPSNDVYALHEDRRGRLWIGLYGGGLCMREEGRLTCYDPDDGLASNNVYALMEDRSGTLWIGTEEGLSLFRDGRIRAYEDDRGLRHGVVTALHEDRTGALWVGTYDGLTRLHEGRTTRYTPADGLSAEVVMALHEDAAGALWIGTQGGGLCRLQDGRFACVTTREGLYNNTVIQILEDDQRNLWLGSNRGFFRISKDEFEAYAAGRQETITSVVFGTADGLESNEASGGAQPTAWKGRDGRLWFTTLRGVASINPANTRTNPLPPPVYIEQVFVDETAVPVAEGLTLAPGSRDVSFHYTGLSLAAPEKVRFRYRLEGYDAHWIEAGARREAYYTGLPPGTYRFRVLACNDDGVWNETGAALTFHLRPFFYQTRWFLALCIALVVVLAVGVHRLRIRQLRARERALERVVDERTHDLRLEKEKTEQSKAVIEAQAEKLRELDRFKTRFFANISHEFRTPLTMLVGPLENALSGGYGVLPDRLRQQTEIMLRNALRLLRLINQLLDLSKLEAGKMQLQARPRDLVAFVEGIVLSCTAFAERKGLDLRFAADVDAAELYFEPDKMEKVFFNLLSNAIKFTPKSGRIDVTLAQLPPDPAAHRPDGAVEVRVRDTGKGIPAAELPYVFDRFHQVDGSNTRDHEGTGIGLSLVKELVLLHHGTVEVESEAGAGTTFVVTLPKGTAHLEQEEIARQTFEEAEAPAAMTELASSDFDYMHADEAPGAARPPAPADAPLVLVVDDNKDVREYVAGILGDEFRVATAENGEEGLAHAHALRPDLIVSDVMMPKMDGNEFCRLVKASPALNHIPVVLLTARATHDMKIEGLRGGADDYMAKPFNAQELLTRLRNLLRLRHQEKALKELNEHLEDKVREQVDAMLDQRRRYEADLVTAKEKAEAAERLKSAILDNMSHEFRTPLTAILGYSEILAAEAPEALHEFAAEVGQNGQRLLKTLDALLELSRLEAAASQPPAAPCDLVDAAAQALEGVRPRASRKGLTLGLDTPDGPGVAARLDRSAVEQVLRHLLDNAVKFTDAGEVRVAVGVHGQEVYLRVRDTGAGMKESFLPHLFEAFTQESAGLTRTYEGAGLGLAVTRRLVDLLGGDIAVETAPGRGTTFTLTFAADAAALPDAVSEAVPEAVPVVAGTSPAARYAASAGDGIGW